MFRPDRDGDCEASGSGYGASFVEGDVKYTLVRVVLLGRTLRLIAGGN